MSLILFFVCGLVSLAWVPVVLTRSRMSLEDLPRDLFQLFARRLHFTDQISLLSVSRAVRKKIIACPGAWNSISFVLLPVTNETASWDEWEVNEATRKMVSFLAANGIASYVERLSFGYKPISDLAPVAALTNLKELVVNSKNVSLAPLRSLQLRVLHVAGLEGAKELGEQSELEELSLTGADVLGELESWPKLRKVRLERCFLHLERLCKALPDLEQLSLWNTAVTTESRGLHVIAELLPKLTFLELCDSSDVTDDLLILFAAKLPLLRHVNVSRCGNVTNRGVAALHRLPRLVSLVHADCANVRSW